MKNFYHFIEDEKELYWFWEYCIPKLNNDEVFFVSLSARNKQLTEEERKELSLGRTEMFRKQIIRKDDFFSLREHILRYESPIGSLLTRNQSNIPQKCLIIYWNINPSSTRKVITQTFEKINELQGELIDSALKRSEIAVNSAFHKLKKFFDSVVSLYARNESEKYWLDFDIDCEKKYLQENYPSLHFFLLGKLGAGNFVEIETKGGMHILVKKSVIKFNPQEIIKGLENAIKVFKEINYNKNSMIPLPGTLQADFLVKIWNKDEFTKADSIKLNLNIAAVRVDKKSTSIA